MAAITRTSGKRSGRGDGTFADAAVAAPPAIRFAAEVKLVAFSIADGPTRPGALLDADEVVDLTHATLALPPLRAPHDAFDLAQPFLAAARQAVARASADARERERSFFLLLPDLLTGMVEQFEKHAWFLHATLGG